MTKHWFLSLLAVTTAAYLIALGYLMIHSWSL